MDGVNIFFVCCNEDQIKTIKENFGDGQLHFSTAFSKEGNVSYYDLMETRRKLSECELVVAFINEKFNDSTPQQYELAVAVLLQKDIAILTDGTSLAHAFGNDFTCLIDLNDNPRWMEILKAKIMAIRSQGRRIDVARSRKDELLQFMWIVEEKSNTNPIKEVKSEPDQREIDKSHVDEISSKNLEVSHSFLCSLLTQSQENIAYKDNQIPKDIKDLCKRHQQKITKCHIRQIGRQLDLDGDQLDTVETYYEHGIPEMFWQLVKIWHKTFPDKVSARRLRRALKSCNINTEETHMPGNHKKVLTQMTEYLVRNILNIDTIMPQLISENVLSDVTKAYVTAPKTRNQQILRLLEVLTTKEHGLLMIVDVFKKSQHAFLADKLIESLPELNEDTRKKPLFADSPSARSSCSSEISFKAINNDVQFRNQQYNHHQLFLNRFHQSKSNSAPASFWTTIHEVPEDKIAILASNECVMQDDSGKCNQEKTTVKQRLCCVIS